MKNYLDDFKNSYSEGFKFHDENLITLSWYSKRVIASLKARPVSSLVSLGIGHKVVCTQIMDHLSEQLDKYLIIEGSQAMIGEFRLKTETHPKISIAHSLFEDFLTNEKFDAIEMGFVLEHVNDPLALLKKYISFLNSKGRMFISVPNARSLHRQIGNKSGILDDLFKLSESDLQLGHQRYFDIDSLVDLVTSAGLNIIKCEGIYLKPFSTDQLNSLDLSNEIIDALCHISTKYPEISNSIFLEATL